MVGSRALGFLKSPQRMNVLLSRAKQKLVLATRAPRTIAVLSSNLLAPRCDGHFCS
jgi:superfamily I DNA and/or RNA helicase